MVSGLMMRHMIMTEKIVRRGVRVPAEYSAISRLKQLGISVSLVYGNDRFGSIADQAIEGAVLVSDST
jgi:tRNA A-37 threonylcarbamoyl transferase component Bud32